MSLSTAHEPPPSEETSPPSDKSKQRFQEISAPTEWIEDYKPRGFHPVHIGDVLCDSRYKILRKLGYGSYSTVWLAKDRKSGYVALKILIANNDVPQNEIAIYEILSQSPVTHPGRAHVMTLRDMFEHRGPNGTHRCLVFDVMGASAETMAECLPVSVARNERRSPVDRSFPLWMAKTMLRQVLEGIDFLHRNEIAHGDVQPGNILFAPEDLSSMDEGQLMQNMTPRDPKNLWLEAGISEPVQSLDGKADRSAPKYLAMNQPLDEYVSLDPRFVVKISDLGAAFPFADPPAEPITPVGLRSPECICGAQISPDQDIWSFGCLIYQFLTGYELFVICGYDEGEEDEADDEHFMQFSSVLGPLPPEILSKWSRSHLYYNSEGKQRDTPLIRGEENEATKVEQLDAKLEKLEPKHAQAGDKPSTQELRESDIMDSEVTEQDNNDDADEDPDMLPLENMFRRYKGSDIDEDQAVVIINVIRSILQYDPKQRPTASQLLKHPWFAESKSRQDR